jgi:hypothetical protein
MRKLPWALSLAGVVGFTAACLAVDYGARNPNTWVGRCTTTVALLGARFNPAFFLGRSATPAQACPRATTCCEEHTPRQIPDDDTPAIEAPQVVGTIRLDVNPIDPPTVFGEEESRQDPTQPATPMPPCPEHQGDTPLRMPYAAEDEPRSWFGQVWECLSRCEKVMTPCLPATSAGEAQEVERREALPDLREDPPYQHHDHGHHMGCPYPFHYHRPMVRPVELPNVERRPNQTSELFKNPIKLLELWLNPWLQRGELPQSVDVDTMEFRPSDANGVPVNGRKF